MNRKRHLSFRAGWPLLLLALLGLVFPLYEWYMVFRWHGYSRTPHLYDLSGFLGQFPGWMREGVQIPWYAVGSSLFAALTAEAARRNLRGRPTVAAAAVFVVAILIGALTLFIQL